MTISNQSAVISLEGDGVNTSWAYSFLIPYKPDGSTPAVQVWLTNPSVFPITPVLIPKSQYSITGIGNSSGGIVTYPLPTGTPIASGIVLTILRAYPYVQEIPVANQGNFFPNAVEGALDYTVEEIQQLVAILARALVVPIGSGIDPDELVAFLIDLWRNGGGGGGGGGGGSTASIGLSYRQITASTPSPAVLSSDHLGIISFDTAGGDITMPFLPSTLTGEQVTFIRSDSSPSVHSAFITDGTNTVRTLTVDQTSVTLKSTGLAIINIPAATSP